MAKENGEMILKTLIQTDMRVIMQMISSMAMENSFGRAVTTTKVNSRMTRKRGMEKCTGQMVAVIKATGSTQYNMAMD